MERPRELPLEVLGEVRAAVAHLATDVADMRQKFRTDIRRLDQRVFQLKLAQFATLAAALGSLVAAPAS
ncbi:MAG: hypothetical protein M3O92_07500 [Actinomycetota bacterium]|nr:hypothetical protein [Actinomycetota bacterium]